MKKYIRTAAVVSCFLICGILYSCGKTKSINLDAFEEEVSMTGSDEDESVEAESEQQESLTVETEGQKFIVYVCGAVQVPDIYEMKAQERIADAISKAGGFSEEADKNYINLAEPVWDGMKIYIPTEQEVKEGYSEQPDTGGITLRSQTGTNDGISSAKININTADEEQLKKLNGIGDSRAKDIVEYRELHGGFKKIEDIMQVPGIKNGMFEKIKDDIEV